MSLHRVLPWLLLPLLVACSDQRAAFEIKGASHSLNLIRVVSLVWIGRHRPALFDSSHTVIWQSAVVLFGVLIFLFWASRQRPRPANAEEKAGR